MLIVFAIVSLVLALACFVYAGWLTALEVRLRLYDPDRPRPPRRFDLTARVALLALLLLALGAGISVVDRTVAPWNAHANSAQRSDDVGGGGDSAFDGSTASGADAGGDYFASHMAAFRGPARLHAGILRRPLCLTRYYDRARAHQRGGDPGATWWTSCRYSASLTTINEVRQRLALPHSWGARDGRVVATIPAGARVTYLAGTAGRQCEPHGGHCYGGGGPQVLFQDADFERSWFTRYECSSAPESRLARFAPCAG